MDFSEKTNSELVSLLEEYGKRIKAMRGWAWIAPAMDTSGAFSLRLNRILEDKLASLMKEHDAPVYFAALTAPRKRTLGKQQDMALLELASHVQDNSNALQLFSSKEPSEIVNGLMAFPLIHKTFLDHVEQFAWLPCTYENDSWNLEYFVTVVAGMLTKKKDVKADLTAIMEKEVSTEETRAAALKELQLSSGERRLFDMAAELLFFKANRKDMFFRSYFEMRPLVAEIARRLMISVEETRMLLPKEMSDALRKESIDRGQLKERMKICTAISENNDTVVLSGSDARQYIEQFTEKPVVKETNELKGTCACPGRATGVVKLILSPRDLSKMNVGDILVANATNPDVVPAMKKAAAIITNTGGITCHAAIVSRELDIPCVVGTKHATDILNDGDRVDVDATAGVVRKVKG
ncbi:hypothetical protein KJ765_06835 [Candidatus Micrarchaeota archaeon]|nr:hypothetical protein [Candidatus Micrarchaeota archaeon]